MWSIVAILTVGGAGEVGASCRAQAAAADTGEADVQTAVVRKDDLVFNASGSGVRAGLRAAAVDGAGVSSHS